RPTAGRISSFALPHNWNRLIPGRLFTRPFTDNDVVGSRKRLSFRESPLAVEDLVLGSVQPDQVVPSRRDRLAIGCRAVAATELNGDPAVGAALGRDVVERIGVLRVGCEVTVFVVDG